jgi:hypothetical protein
MQRGGEKRIKEIETEKERKGQRGELQIKKIDIK